MADANDYQHLEPKAKVQYVELMWKLRDLSGLIQGNLEAKLKNEKPTF